MKFIGFSYDTIEWFHSYLTNRTFFNLLDSVFSEGGTINSRVHQGFILGHLLLTIYINDVLQALPNSHTYPYADDKSIFYQHKNVTQIENVLDIEFANVCYSFCKDKINTFFSAEKKLPELIMTCRNNRINEYDMVEYFR